MQNTYYEFREAANIDELRELLQLRYRVYQESRLATLSKEVGNGMDIDAYDLRAMHFGLFKMENGNSIPIGYHRIVQDKIGSMHREVMQIAGEFAGVAEKIIAPPSSPFPIMTYSDQPVIERLCSEGKSSGKTIIEATKFSIEPEERSLDLARFVIDSELAIHLFCNNTDHALMAICTSHMRFYRRYGFEIIPGTETANVGRLSGVAVSTSRRQIPSPVRQRLMRMAVAYLETGSVCYNPARLQSFYAPKIEQEIEVGMAT